ncbi:MAG: ATP-binding protein [Cyclobacteriaceae bacterium]
MLRKICVLGPESTGKSELCQHLSRIYNTEWVPEYARFYLDRLGRPYEQSDLIEIAKGQLIWEDDKAEYANKYLFCDTDMTVLEIWSNHKYGQTDPWILKELHARVYDFYLLTNIDIPWLPDPQRENPKDRKYFLNLFKTKLQERNLPYALVSGIEDARTACAKMAIDAYFKQ